MWSWQRKLWKGKREWELQSRDPVLEWHSNSTTSSAHSWTLLHKYTLRLSFLLSVSHVLFPTFFPLHFPSFPFSLSVSFPLSSSAGVSCIHPVTTAQKAHFCQPLIAQRLGSTGLATVTAASSENSSREAEKWREMLSSQIDDFFHRSVDASA